MRLRVTNSATKKPSTNVNSLEMTNHTTSVAFCLLLLSLTMPSLQATFLRGGLQRRNVEGSIPMTNQGIEDRRLCDDYYSGCYEGGANGDRVLRDTGNGEGLPETERIAPGEDDAERERSLVNDGYENPEMEDEQSNVQVNAGYENPEIVCLGSSCSGVMLNDQDEAI